MAMPAGELWATVRDPYHLARWWPRVERVEGVQAAFFTEVLRSANGKLVRADFEVREIDEQAMRIVWAQQIAGTPFERVLASAETVVQVSARPGMNARAATEVTLTLAQTLRGLLPRPQSPDGGRVPAWSLARLGSPLVSRAAAKTVREALDGLQQLSG